MASEESESQAADGLQAGDLQTLPKEALDDSESVEELAREGQDFEGELVKGLEDALPADQGDIKTHRPAEPEDDTPDYKDRNLI